MTSSDESIAIIEEGKVKCVGAGSAVIIARSKANATKKAEANLTVLGTDEYGRSENLFEAEDANIIQASYSRDNRSVSVVILQQHQR